MDINRWRKVPSVVEGIDLERFKKDFSTYMLHLHLPSRCVGFKVFQDCIRDFDGFAVSEILTSSLRFSQESTRHIRKLASRVTYACLFSTTIFFAW